MPIREHKKISGSPSIEWPIMSTINSTYSGRLKYVHTDFTTNSDYVILDIPNSTSTYAVANHTIVVCSPTQIIATANLTYQTTTSIMPLCTSMDGYFGYVPNKSGYIIYILKYNSNNGTITADHTISNSYNWPMTDRYAYKIGSTPYFSIGKCNTRQTPGCAAFTGSSQSAAETNGRTGRMMITHQYAGDSSKPYLSLIWHVSGSGGSFFGLIVKSANNYGFGLGSDSSTTSFSNCVAVSNSISNLTSAMSYPIFGRNPLDTNNYVRFAYAGSWYQLQISSDFSSISLGNAWTPLFAGSIIFISETQYYECDPNNNYDFVLRTLS